MLTEGAIAHHSSGLCAALQANTNSCATLLANSLSAAILGFLTSAFESTADLLEVTCIARGAFKHYLSTDAFDAVMVDVEARVPCAERTPPIIVMGTLLPTHLQMFVCVAQDWQNTLYEHISTRVRGKATIAAPLKEWPVLSVLQQQQQTYYLAGDLPTHNCAT